MRDDGRPAINGVINAVPDGTIIDGGTDRRAPTQDGPPPEDGVSEGGWAIAGVFGSPGESSGSACNVNVHKKEPIQKKGEDGSIISEICRLIVSTVNHCLNGNPQTFQSKAIPGEVTINPATDIHRHPDVDGALVRLNTDRPCSDYDHLVQTEISTEMPKHGQALSVDGRATMVGQYIDTGDPNQFQFDTRFSNNLVGGVLTGIWGGDSGSSILAVVGGKVMTVGWIQAKYDSDDANLSSQLVGLGKGSGGVQVNQDFVRAIENWNDWPTQKRSFVAIVKTTVRGEDGIYKRDLTHRIFSLIILVVYLEIRKIVQIQS